MLQLHLNDLPPSVRELAELIGLTPTLAIVEERGGIGLYVPERARASHWLARLIGMDALRNLCGRHAGEPIPIPRCARALRAIRDLQIIERLAAGESCWTLAREHGMTERNIWYIVERYEQRYGRPAESRQDVLF